MRVKEVLKLEGLTENYYSCKICKEEDVILDFGDLKLYFIGSLIFKCGYPNEEVYMHYDYYTQGPMRKYHLYEILDSEWIKELTKMNRVHPRHSDDLFREERHFIVLFEDEVFECVASSYKSATNKDDK